jgi:hypothetical protein
VAIELQSGAHLLFKDVPDVDRARLDAYLSGTEDPSETLVGELDSTGQFRCAGGELTIKGKEPLRNKCSNVALTSNIVLMHNVVHGGSAYC